MSITLEEAKQKYAQSRKESAENLVRKNWYRILVSALEEQQYLGEVEPDFSSYWMNANHELLLAASEYYDGADTETDTKDNYELIAEMIQMVVGDELDVYGLVPHFFPVHAGFESAVWMYLLKPGQKPRAG